MNITFNIHYKTRPGQDLYITGSPVFLGKNNMNKAFPMVYSGEGNWQANVFAEDNSVIYYQYFIRQPNGTIMLELGSSRQIDLGDYKTEQVALFDTWFWPDNKSKPFYTAAFSNALLKPDFKSESRSVITDKSLVFRIRIPRIAKGFMACISGNWNKNEIQLLTYNAKTCLWEIALSRDNMPEEVHYKYGIFDQDKNKLLYLEDGHGRHFSTTKKTAGSTILKNDELFYYPEKPWKGAGVAIPVFSLRTKDGFGVGEFPDLKKLIDWARKTKLKLIQVLPVNDTISANTVTDSNPYKAISVMALHPMYLNLDDVGEFPDKGVKAKYLEEKEQLNNLAEVDYETMIHRKLFYLDILYQTNKNEVFKKDSYKRYYAENKHWLQPYAVFCYLRKKYQTADYKLWKVKYSVQLIEEYCGEQFADYQKIHFYFYMQYYLHQQLCSATDYARENGVVLKGDIPIGIHPESVDAWSMPDLFNLDVNAGAPPDDFSNIGQNWELPTYNWEQMERNNYRWWRERLTKMACYFDAIRFDHILGFFRIWEIPVHAVQGLMGYFNPAKKLGEEDFKYANINFKLERFTEPFINKTVVNKVFGEYADEVLKKYFDVNGSTITLKKKYYTQRKVDDAFKKKNKLSSKERFIREGLFQIQANVLFIPSGETKTQKYYPRIKLHETLSFKYLDTETQEKLKSLHDHYFYRLHNDFWYMQAMKKLPAITRSTNMLICGEDLGMVPDCVAPVMDSLGILGLEIERMPKQPGLHFAKIKEAPYLSVCSTSSHDTTGLRVWWEKENRHKTEYYHQFLGETDHTPASATPELCRAIVRNFMRSQAMWVTLPIQDLFAMDGELRSEHPEEERVNIPGVSGHPWVYRMHVDIEQLLAAEKFNHTLSEIVEQCGRDSVF